MVLLFWGPSLLVLLSEFMNAQASAGRPRGLEKGTSTLTSFQSQLDRQRMNDLFSLGEEKPQ